MADIYLCYSQKDQDTAETIAGILEPAGLSCFMVTRDMDYTRDWDEQIEQAVKSSVISVYLKTDAPSGRIDGELKLIETSNTTLMTFDPLENSAEDIASEVTDTIEKARQEKERRSRIYPYTGEEPYIFASYSHIDMETVFDIIRGFQKRGYRIWFDEGIDPGVEWDEYIATHIDSSSYLISFLSENYYGSTNCRDELAFARELNKPLLLIYIKDDEMPAGMKLRLNRIQAVHWYRFADKDEFYEKAGTAAGIEICREKEEE